MTSFDTLVVGVDGSEASVTALVWAADRVTATGTIHAVHGFNPSRSRTLDVFRPSWDERRAEIEEGLPTTWTAAARREGVTLRTHLVDDEPDRALLDLADANDADVIVVGPHNKRGNPLMLGSVTRKLLQETTRPLVVARAPALPGNDSPSSPRKAGGRVVACVGYGEATTAAAMWAADYASRSGVGLTLLHAVGRRPMFPFDSPSDTLASYLGSDVSQEWAQEDLDELRQEVSEAHPDLDIATSVEQGFATRVIAAAGAEAELVVLGKRQRGSLTKMVVSPRVQQAVSRSAATVAVIPSCSTEE